MHAPVLVSVVALLSFGPAGFLHGRGRPDHSCTRSKFSEPVSRCSEKRSIYRSISSLSDGAYNRSMHKTQSEPVRASHSAALSTHYPRHSERLRH
jgi:hypothetical protein